ncbi:MAG: hypothetical protein R2857_00400 [Vampirovibrionales bacterium]
MDYVICEEVVIDLADAQQLWEKEQPDLLIVDLTAEVPDACLFYRGAALQRGNKTTVFGLHKELDPNIILKAVSSGVKEFIHYPKDQDALTTALSKYHQYHQKLIQARIDSGRSRQAGRSHPRFFKQGRIGRHHRGLEPTYELMHTANKKVAFYRHGSGFQQRHAYLNFKPTFSISRTLRTTPNRSMISLSRKSLSTTRKPA